MAYLDNILIYGKMLQKYEEQVKKVVEVLSTASLYLKPEKCEFHKTEVKYLDLIILVEGIKIDLKKIKAIVEWGKPKNLYDLQLFLGFSNFHR